MSMTRATTRTTSIRRSCPAGGAIVLALTLAACDGGSNNEPIRIGTTGLGGGSADAVDPIDRQPLEDEPVTVADPQEALDPVEELEPVLGLERSDVPPEFIGTWQTDCNVVNGVGTRSLVIFDATSLESGSLGYLDSRCATSPVAETRLSTEAEFGARVTLADGSEAVETDVTITGTVRMTPLTDFFARQLTLEGACGLDWSANVEYDVSDCDELIGAVQPLFDRTAPQIYAVQGDDLLIGRVPFSPFDPLPQTRPTELNYTLPFRRVAP